MSLLDTASLIVTPNGYKEDKLYSVIPSDGSGDMSVTRATTATRVNSAGLVELVPYNLLSYSEQFNNAYWTNNGASVSANAIVSPNGTTTADKIIENSSNGVHHILMPNVTPSGTNTLSVYAKQGERNWVWLYLFDGVAGSLFAWFDVSTGTVGGVNSGLTATIESVGNGWYRCSITRTQGNTGNGGFGVTNANNVLSYTGNGTSGAYFWGAQLVEGSVAKPYQKTETRLNIPRLDYSNGTCPSLLVEPQRTNLLTYSSSFDNADWNNSGLTITANQTISPSGVQDADLFDDGTAANTVHWMWQGQSLANSTTYTISFYAKYVSRKNIVVNIYNGSTSQFVNYNIQNGSILGSIGDVTATIESVGNGWYRCTYTRTMASSGSPNYRIGLSDDSGNQSYTGSNKQAYIWGAQLEAGSYPTSYIPTTSASVTRNADVISKTGISSLIGQTEGTIFIDTYIDNIASQTNEPVLFYLRGVAEVYIEITPTGRVYGVFYNGTTSTGFINANIGLQNGRHKMAFGYKDNDFVLYVDGTQVGTDTSGTVSGSLTEFGLQYYQNFYVGTQEINASAIWKTRLTNTQLAQLTTI